MKKIFMSIFLVATAVSLQANYVYDPVLNMAYSTPQTPDINQVEYRNLILACNIIINNMEIAKAGAAPSKSDILRQLSYFLKRIGTPTALRLLSDFQKNKIYYPDGSVARNIW